MRAQEEKLIGYLLNALDENEHQEVERELQANPEMAAQLSVLKKAMEPLEADAEAPLPPKTLVERTMHAIDESTSLPQAPAPIPFSGAARGWWRRADVVAACFLLVFLTGFGAVWVARAWNEAGRTECQDNLAKLHRSLTDYASLNNDDFPRAEPNGPLSFAGAYAPLLREAGLLSNGASVVCPLHGQHEPAPVTTTQLREWYQTNPERYRESVLSAGGSYAYSLGFRHGGHVRGLRQGEGHGMLPILADGPPLVGMSPAVRGNSHHHDGRGQNVLFVNGSVRFCTARTVGYQGDDIYLNRHNKARAGQNLYDSVLGTSGAVPIAD